MSKKDTVKSVRPRAGDGPAARGRRRRARGEGRNDHGREANYTGADIQVLEGLEPVRKRPGMYIGGTDSDRLPPPAVGDRRQLGRRGDQRPRHPHRGDAAQGRQDASPSTTTAAASPSTSMPKYKKSALEVILTTLHSGGKFEKRQLHALGRPARRRRSVVNALSSELVVAGQARRQAPRADASRAASRPSKLKVLGNARGTGTTDHFQPDPEIFGAKLTFDAELIRERLEAKSYLHKGLKVVFVDETATPKTDETFQHDGGIAEYLQKLIAERGKAVVPPRRDALLQGARERRCGSSWRWRGPRPPTSTCRATSTASPRANGGTHENGLQVGRRQGGAQLHRDARPDAQGRDAHRRGHPRGPGRASCRSTSRSRSSRARPRTGSTTPRSQRPGRRRGAPGAREVAQRQQADRRGDRRRASSSRRGRARRRARPRRRSTRKTAVSHRLNLPGKLADCSLDRSRRERAVHRRGRLRRRLGQAGPRPRHPGDPAAARQGAQRRAGVDRQGARQQGAAGHRQRARLRHRRRLRPRASCATARSSC